MCLALILGKATKSDKDSLYYLNWSCPNVPQRHISKDTKKLNSSSSELALLFLFFWLFYLWVKFLSEWSTVQLVSFWPTCQFNNFFLLCYQKRHAKRAESQYSDHSPHCLWTWKLLYIEIDQPGTAMGMVHFYLWKPEEGWLETHRITESFRNLV